MILWREEIPAPKGWWKAIEEEEEVDRPSINSSCVGDFMGRVLVKNMNLMDIEADISRTI